MVKSIDWENTIPGNIVNNNQRNRLERKLKFMIVCSKICFEQFMLAYWLAI